MQLSIPYKTSDRLIISLFDYTGAWARPYIKAGYPVMLWDYKVEGDILEGFSRLHILIEESGLSVHGVLAAPPCTHFAVSGARHFAKKDEQAPAPNDVWNDVDYHIAYVHIVLHLVDIVKPKFWVMENPIGRIETLIPDIKPYRRMMFNPCDYGDPYTKKTILWGNFNTALPKNPVEPQFTTYIKKDGSVTRFAPQFGRTGGKSEKTKEIRSATPMGFANAFFEANN